MSSLFWLSDEQWTAIASLMPEGGVGPKRLDDRVVISGIIHVLKSGCAWRDCPRE
ncbi:MAG: transposase, partial [Pseudorhodoplanes sp.]